MSDRNELEIKTIDVGDDIYVDAVGKGFLRAVFKCHGCGLIHRVQLGVPTHCSACIDTSFYRGGVQFVDAGPARWYEDSPVKLADRFFRWLGTKIPRINYR